MVGIYGNPPTTQQIRHALAIGRNRKVSARRKRCYRITYTITCYVGLVGVETESDILGSVHHTALKFFQAHIFYLNHDQVQGLDFIPTTPSSNQRTNQYTTSSHEGLAKVYVTYMSYDVLGKAYAKIFTAWTIGFNNTPYISTLRDTANITLARSHPNR